MLRFAAIALFFGGAMFADAAVAPAEEPYESAAKRLSAATVTVTARSLRAEGDDSGGKLAKPRLAKPDAAKAELAKAIADDRAKPANRVGRSTIGSGVAVGENLIVTAVRPDRNCQISLTMPGGGQADAKLCVVDENSTLALLEFESLEDGDVVLPHVALSQKEMSVGSRLLAASAWGAEPPLVSLGVLSGADRYVPGTGFPPLVQCDVRTTETSLGAGIVNVNGELIGIVVACEGEGRNSQWTYAVAADHVRRLLDARREGQVVEIRRRRPHAGIELRQLGGSEDIVVRSVAPGGPAAKAGIEVGDVIETFDGRAARSVLEAARQVGCRKPGDAVELQIRRGDRSIKCVVTLEQGEDEPRFSYASKEPREQANLPAARQRLRADDGSDAAGLPKGEDASGTEDAKSTDPRPKQRASGRGIGSDADSDLLEEFREQLRQRDERISRLEAELAELRRERLLRPAEADPPAKAAVPPLPLEDKGRGSRRRR